MCNQGVDNHLKTEMSVAMVTGDLSNFPFAGNLENSFGWINRRRISPFSLSAEWNRAGEKLAPPPLPYRQLTESMIWLQLSLSQFKGGLTFSSRHVHWRFFFQETNVTTEMRMRATQSQSNWTLSIRSVYSAHRLEFVDNCCTNRIKSRSRESFTRRQE